MEIYYGRKVVNPVPGKVIGLVPKPSPKIIEGFGRRAEVGHLCKESGYSRVLLVTDRTLFGLGFHEVLADSLKKEGIECTVFSEIDSEPTARIISAGRKAAVQSQAQCIIALGGGSVMDSCKVIAAGARLRHLRTRELLIKFLAVPGKTLPMITIPSTAGTGAEITVGAIVKKNDGGSKGSTVIVGLNIIATVLDSELMVRTPGRITAACGIDALSHGIEGYLADIDSGKDNERLSMECVRLVFENLPKVLDKPSDIQARQAMCLAAHYGGNAINTQLAGYVHAFAHTLGAMYHLSHGEAISLSILPVLRYQQPVCRGRMSELAAACGVSSPAEDSFTSSDRFLDALEALLKKCRLDVSGSVVRREDYEAIISLVKRDAINYSSPVVLNRMEITHILEEIRKIRI